MTTPLTPKYHATPTPLTAEEREIFTKARALIENPSRHAQGALAISQTGRLVEPTDPAAYYRCGIGALLTTIGTPCQIDPPAIPLINRLSLITEIVLDDDRIPFTHVNDGLISDVEFPEEMQSMTPHQRVLYIYDKILENNDAA